MATKKVQVTLKGISPLLMHRYPLEPVEAIDKLKPVEQAEISAYRDPQTGELYMPAVAVQRALVNGATYSKGKGRASLQKPVSACVFVTPERLPLGTKEFEVDSRPVVMPSTKGRILRHRPRLDEWSCSFDLEFDPTLLTEDQMRRIVDDTCSRGGFLDFRPEKKGSYGRAMVTEWVS